ncbi:MAG: hypothetical protein KJ896_02505, partial [Nanoarchaeota archaeon]|nr:hypothetical protein [Nanoarchaeota archaeon]
IELLCKVLAYNIERAMRDIIEMLKTLMAFLQSRCVRHRRIAICILKSKLHLVYKQAHNWGCGIDIFYYFF